MRTRTVVVRAALPARSAPAVHPVTTRACRCL